MGKASHGVVASQKGRLRMYPELASHIHSFVDVFRLPQMIRNGEFSSSSSSGGSGVAAPAVDSSAGSAGLNVDSGATKRKRLKGRRGLMIGSGNPTGGITTGVGLNI